MRPIGWLFTCLLFTSAISTRVLSKKGHPVERKETLVIPTAAIPLSAQQSKLLDHGNELLDFNRNNNVARPDTRDGKQRILDDLGGARTFGHKRIQFMLMPLMYKMGVMMTLLTVLTIISLKGLLIGAILLILKLATIVGKFTSGWSSYAHHPPAASLPFHGWSSPSSQPIHLHLHNSVPHGHPSHPYHAHAWMSASAPDFTDPLDRSQIEHYYYKG